MVQGANSMFRVPYKGFLGGRRSCPLLGDDLQERRQRLKVLRFWEHHGLSATEEAFGVSRRTLYAWQAQLRAGGGRAHTRTPRSTRPQRLRQRVWPTPLIQEIRRLRRAHPNLGKEKLFPFIRSARHRHSSCQACAPSGCSSAMRPVADRAVLKLIDTVTFTGADFSIQHDGVCRINPELARTVAQLALGIAQAAGSRETSTGTRLR